MTHRDLIDQANICYCEPSVFIVLPIIRNQSKTKTIPCTIFERFINSSWWFHHVGCLSGDVGNIHKKFFIRNYYWNLKLSIGAVSSVIKCSP